MWFNFNHIGVLDGMRVLFLVLVAITVELLLRCVGSFLSVQSFRCIGAFSYFLSSFLLVWEM